MQANGLMSGVAWMAGAGEVPHQTADCALGLNPKTVFGGNVYG